MSSNSWFAGCINECDNILLIDMAIPFKTEATYAYLDSRAPYCDQSDNHISKVQLIFQFYFDRQT